MKPSGFNYVLHVHIPPLVAPTVDFVSVIDRLTNIITMNNVMTCHGFRTEHLPISTPWSPNLRKSSTAHEKAGQGIIKYLKS